MAFFDSPKVRGGARPGAGRPKLPPGEKKEPYELWAKPATLDAFLKAADLHGLSPGDFLDLLLSSSPSDPGEA